MMRVANAMVKCLEKENISVVFGYPGAAICPFYNALHDADIQHILVRHEQHAAHAASGYARMSGKPAVCIATSGPGATNLITGIATAYADSVPLVAITGQVNVDQIGKDVFQEADVIGSTEPFVKHSYLVKDGKDIPRIMKEAFHIAGSGRPGPVLIDVPMDVQNQKIEFSYPKSVNIRSYKPSAKGHEGQIRRVADALEECQRPLLCAGGGVFTGTSRQLFLELAEKCDIPVITTMMGIGCIPSNHHLNLGMIGSHGVKLANHALHRADLLILVGARVGDRSVAAPGVLEKKMRVVHIDIDPAEIGKNVDTHIPVVGDAQIILQQIIDMMEETHHDDWVETLQKKRKEYCKDFMQTKGYINPKEFIQLLSQRAPQDSIAVADVGQNQIWSANNFQIQQGRFLTTGGMGTMGYSVPAALGAKLYEPDKTVLAICGDGSFQMNMMELGTICQHNICVKIIIMKNNFLGMVRELQTNLYDDRRQAVFLNGSPDFSMLAKAYGIPSQTISDIQDAEAAIDTLLHADSPYVLEVLVPPEETALQ